MDAINVQAGDMIQTLNHKGAWKTMLKVSDRFSPKDAIKLVMAQPSKRRIVRGTEVILDEGMIKKIFSNWA